jgi:epoxyqueuosine reductase
MSLRAARIRDILADNGISDSAVVSGPLGELDSPGVIACALPYPLGADPIPGIDDRPFGVLASFARRHYYRILAGRLIRARDAIRASLGAEGANPPTAKSGFPIHVNSRIDEKKLACAAGLGSIGRHSLLISEASGCACVLGAMGLPFAPEGAELPPEPERLHPSCRVCGACLRACPTGAIKEEGGIDRDLCLQAYMSDDRPVPEIVKKAWGRRFYGCDECLRACPRSEGAHTLPLDLGEEKIGLLGDRIDLRSIIADTDSGLSERFKGSALGLSWLGPATLRKNASLALLAWTEGGK